MLASRDGKGAVQFKLFLPATTLWPDRTVEELRRGRFTRFCGMAFKLLLSAYGGNLLR